MSNEGFSFKKLYEDSKKALFQPKEYFSTMETQGGLGEPILKALVYGAIAGVFALLWSLLNLSGFTGGLLGGAVGIAAFFWSIIGAVIGVFVGGLIVLIISSICNGNSEFEPNMRIAAAIMVVLPINTFLGFFGGISHFLDAIIGLAVNLYALYMLYIAVTETLKGKPQPAKAVSYILGGLLVLFMIIGLATRSAVKKYSGFGSKEATKAMKKYEEAAKKVSEQMAKEYEEAAKEMEESVNAYRLEMAGGESVSDASRSDVRKALSDLGPDNDYMILSKAGKFVQVAVTDNGYLMEYRDAKGYYRSVEDDLSLNTVKDVFFGFLDEEDNWKEDIEWERAE